MYRRGMTSYIGAAWRLKREAMSISTMGVITATGGHKFIGRSLRRQMKFFGLGRFRYLNT
jgi:hypothetical protein